MQVKIENIYANMHIKPCKYVKNMQAKIINYNPK